MGGPTWISRLRPLRQSVADGDLHGTGDHRGRIPAVDAGGRHCGAHDILVGQDLRDLDRIAGRERESAGLPGGEPIAGRSEHPLAAPS